MPFLHENREAGHQASPVVVSPNRPPQLNQTVCGCRCGCGCSNVFLGSDGAEDGGNHQGGIRGSVLPGNRASASDQSDNEETLSPNAPDQNVAHETFESHQLPPAQPRENGVYEIPTRYGGFLNDVHGFRLSQRVVEQSPLPSLFRTASRPTFEIGPDSVNNGEQPSNSASGAMNIRCISPGPGIGAWVDDEQLSGYHTHNDPLRLIVQWRLYGGTIASPVVVWDDVTLVDGENGFLEDVSVVGYSFR